MKNLLITCLFALLFTSAYTQELKYEELDWEESPTWTELDSIYQNEQEVELKFEKTIELGYSEKYNNSLLEYLTIHRIVRVQGDDAIELNNRVYISMRNTVEIIEAKARVLTPDNEIINFDESNIQESEGGDGLDGYKYFAIDGIVKGSNVEFMYTLIKLPTLNGSKHTFQDDAMSTNVSFEFIAPSNLEIAFKSYNGFAEMEKDSTNEDKNVYTAQMDVIEAMKEEDYSAYSKNLQHVIYKLDHNYYTRVYNIVTFGQISQNVYSNYYAELDKHNTKALKKIIDESGANDEDSKEEKIRLIERYFKTHFGIMEGVKSKPIKDVVADGFTSSIGMTYMCIQAFRMMNIKHELVMTSNRHDDIFDEDFQHDQVLRNAMIYFPKLKLYMAPGEQLYRLGMVPSEWTHQKGLFIKEVTVGEMKTGLGKVKFITALDADVTKDNMDIRVDFSDINSPIVEFERSMSGYSIVFFQGIYGLLEEDAKTELDENFIMFADKNGEVLDYEISGTEEIDCGINPIVYTGKLETTTLMEKAGNRYLFKIGQIIGPQMEMYQEEERITDIVHDHNMTYNRTITFDIPDGFEVSGLEALKIKEHYPKESPIIQFESDYSMEGNTVVVNIIERYEEPSFTKEEITDFRRIINAAANFNKVVLFLVKE